MDDEQCDLEALSALLEEDTPTENSAPNQTTNEEEELCFSDSEDDADLDVLASLVENETQEDKKKEQMSSPSLKTQAAQRQSKPVTPSPCLPAAVNNNDGNMDAAHLQEELRQMQEKMLMLQQQLSQQQQMVQQPQKSSRQINKKPVPIERISETQSSEVSSSRKQTECTKALKQYNLGDKDNVNPFFPSENTKAPNNNKQFPSEKTGTPNNSKQYKRKVSGSDTPSSDTDNKAAFFPDSDSDWDDMDGEKEAGLSKEGKMIKKIMKGGSRQRAAHTPKYSPPLPKTDTPETKWRKKSTFDSHTRDKICSPPSNGHTVKSNEKEEVMFFSGIRIINPKVSSELLKIKMYDRKQMKMSKLSQKLNTADLEGNWVTFGILVHKSETRKSSNGNTYCIWKLSDLEDEDHTMTFFLFRDVYKTHWKCQLGTVLGLLNPNPMQKAEKFQSENSFTVDHPGQILIIGQSKDLGTCKGTTKSGKLCTNFINKRQGEYCKYHVQSVYKKASAKRGDLQSGFSGVVPKAFTKKMIPSGSHVFYGGQTFSTLPSCGKKVSKNNVNLHQLQKHTSSAKGKVTTLSLHELEGGNAAGGKETAGKETGGKGVEDKPFLDFLSTPTVGSLNLVKHLIKKESSEETKTNKVLVETITPAELLKQHRQQMAAIKQRQKAKSRSPGVTAGPQLGKGLRPGDDIFLGGTSFTPRLSGSPKITRPRNTEVAKKRAIAKVMSKGGISKQDPNAVRKTLTSPENEQRIKKRVADSLKSDEETSPSSSDQPPAKKSRYLGNVDLNSEDVKKLLKAKSSHSGALSEIQAEQREKYFGELEKKEQYEEKMTSVTEIKCTAYTCHQCKYTALKSSDLCKAEGHKVIQLKTAKRFYKCTSCKTRTMTLHRYPTVPCRSCHNMGFERTSMWKEKEGPKLESEILLVTGDAAKNLDSQMR